MKATVSYRWLVGVFIALFFALQSFSLAHATEHNGEPHEHDGITCAVTVLSNDQAVILPEMPVFDTLISETFETGYPDFTSAVYLTPQSRAPPPRGPPTSI